MAKLVLFILGIWAIIGLGFVALVFAGFSSDPAFNVPLVVAVGLALLAILTVKTFNLLSPKVFRIVFVSLGVVFIATIAGYNIYHSYLDSIPTVSEQDVDIRDYRPFQTGNKLATLDQESTLSLTDNLPVLDGATALYPVYSAFVQAVYPRADYNIWDSEVMCTTTPQAYENLFKGEADIIFVAAPSRAQLQEAENQGIQLKFTPIGREAFVFFVNPDNPVEDLSVEDIQGIYSGKITNWREVGGRSQSIRAFQRPEGSGSQSMLQRIMEDIPLMTPPSRDVPAGMGGIIRQTSTYRNHSNAIGFSFLYFATEMVQDGDIRLLSINGVYPNADTIMSGAYPFTGEFFAVINAANTNPNVDKFLDWIASPQGQELVQKTGYTPLVDHE